jgi:hypothetical protein
MDGWMEGRMMDGLSVHDWMSIYYSLLYTANYIDYYNVHTYGLLRDRPGQQHIAERKPPSPIVVLVVVVVVAVEIRRVVLASARSSLVSCPGMEEFQIPGA